MSQDLFLFPTRGETEIFDRALVLRILNKDAKAEIDDVPCSYVDGSRGECFGLDKDDPGERFDSLMFSHFGGRMMMERIFELADAFEVIVVWTDCSDNEPNACVTRPDRLDRISNDVAQDLNLVVARDASHLNQLVRGATFEENGWV